MTAATVKPSTHKHRRAARKPRATGSPASLPAANRRELERLDTFVPRTAIARAALDIRRNALLSGAKLRSITQIDDDLASAWGRSRP